MTTFKIEKETKWDGIKLVSRTHYFIWANSSCLGVTSSEEEAMKIYEAAKQHYVESKSEIIKEETIGQAKQPTYFYFKSKTKIKGYGNKIKHW